MSHLRLTTKRSLIAGAAMVLSFAAVPLHAHAKGAPQGTYLRTCAHVATRGDTLIADCRRTTEAGAEPRCVMWIVALATSAI